MSDTATVPDRFVAEFLDLAKSAHVYFELVNDHLTMRAVNPHWEMWQPLRHLLDEIGAPAIEAYLRRAGAQSHPATFAPLPWQLPLERAGA